MEGLTIKRLRDAPAYCSRAASWFFQKWGIPEELYQESIRTCIEKYTGIPQWYVVLDSSDEIIAGVGAIDNDFHSRKDLCPNLCALFVEEDCRGQGVARALLHFVRKDLGTMGVEKLYLVTDHAAFYEKCGWEYLTDVKGDDGGVLRMYTASAI